VHMMIEPCIEQFVCVAVVSVLTRNMYRDESDLLFEETQTCYAAPDVTGMQVAPSFGTDCARLEPVIVRKHTGARRRYLIGATILTMPPTIIVPRPGSEQVSFGITDWPGRGILNLLRLPALPRPRSAAQGLLDDARIPVEPRQEDAG
jgi:hypothetical protein